jgi:hypothetical protein
LAATAASSNRSIDRRFPIKIPDYLIDTLSWESFDGSDLLSCSLKDGNYHRIQFFFSGIIDDKTQSSSKIPVFSSILCRLQETFSMWLMNFCLISIRGGTAVILPAGAFLDFWQKFSKA